MRNGRLRPFGGLGAFAGRWIVGITVGDTYRSSPLPCSHVPMSKKPARPRSRSRVAHVLKIERWSFDYSFDVGDERKAYSDTRQILFNVKIEKPADIKAKAGLVRLFTANSLTSIEDKPRQNFVDRETGKIRPVGRVWYSGKDYQAVLFFPGDMLAPALTMLSAEKYRYVILSAEEDGRETLVDGFTLAEFHGDKPDLAASWDDV